MGRTITKSKPISEQIMDLFAQRDQQIKYKLTFHFGDGSREEFKNTAWDFLGVFHDPEMNASYYQFQKIQTDINSVFIPVNQITFFRFELDLT